VYTQTVATRPPRNRVLEFFRPEAVPAWAKLSTTIIFNAYAKEEHVAIWTWEA